TPEALAANLAGNLVAPLLNRASIEAAYRQANARQVQAVLEYEKTLLQAYTDVVNQLARYRNLMRSYGLQSEQVAILGRSIDVSTMLFQAARADYGEVLLVRRESLDAQTELIETKKRLLLSTVDLYVALGGGWRGTDPEALPSGGSPQGAPAPDSVPATTPIGTVTPGRPAEVAPTGSASPGRPGASSA
ncbi:MAG: TolC family protein, partial [Alphaproteobacteria bacterium]